MAVHLSWRNTTRHLHSIYEFMLRLNMMRCHWLHHYSDQIVKASPTHLATNVIQLHSCRISGVGTCHYQMLIVSAQRLGTNGPPHSVDRG